MVVSEANRGRLRAYGGVFKSAAARFGIYIDAQGTKLWVETRGNNVTGFKRTPAVWDDDALELRLVDAPQTVPAAIVRERVLVWLQEQRPGWHSTSAIQGAVKGDTKVVATVLRELFEDGLAALAVGAAKNLPGSVGLEQWEEWHRLRTPRYWQASSHAGLQSVLALAPTGTDSPAAAEDGGGVGVVGAAPKGGTDHAPTTTPVGTAPRTRLVSTAVWASATTGPAASNGRKERTLMCPRGRGGPRVMSRPGGGVWAPQAARPGTRIRPSEQGVERLGLGWDSAPAALWYPGHPVAILSAPRLSAQETSHTFKPGCETPNPGRGTMPKQQQGTVVKRGPRNYGARYHDEQGRRRYQGGFQTQTAAEAWLRTRVAEVAAVRRGDTPRPNTLPTVDELIDSFLATHEVDPATTSKPKYELAHARRAFGTQRIDQLRPVELQAWRATLPPRTRHQPFASWAEVEAISAELPERYRAIPVVLVGTGLRPEELYGLERRDVDHEHGVLNIERVYTQGRLKPCMKSDRQRRRVPLRARVLAALDVLPPRIDTPVLFPAADGGHIKHGTFRLRHWTPALRAAGIEHRGAYSCRHTFAAWSIRAGVQLYYLARIMGTSVAQIDRTLLGAGLRRVPARPAGRVRRRAYRHCCGTVGAQSGMATRQ